jgi:Fe2+ transport protein
MTGQTAPTRRVTDEASKEGLRLAQEAGDAYQRMVDYFVAHVATAGAKKRAGDFVVGIATEEAEPLWHLLGGRLELKEPAADLNAHLEVVVMDAADHRFVPELTVDVTVAQRNGDEMGTFRLPFLWHPTMYHYGQSIHLDEPGDYDLTVRIAPPTFGRHDKTNGRRYAEPVSVTFEEIRLEPGRKT